MGQTLALEEQETIINFNKGEKMASIFTYDKTWQQHLEKRLGLKPISNNGFGAREYLIDKKRIRPPRAPLKLSPEQRRRTAARLQQGRRQKSLNRAADNTTEKKSAPKGGKGV